VKTCFPLEQQLKQNKFNEQISVEPLSQDIFLFSKVNVDTLEVRIVSNSYRWWINHDIKKDKIK
jgi:hypothetical protein